MVLSSPLNRLEPLAEDAAVLLGPAASGWPSLSVVVADAERVGNGDEPARVRYRPAARLRFARASAQSLTAFLALATAADDDIVAFARTAGALLPFRAADMVADRPSSVGELDEAIDGWRVLARGLQQILVVAERLQTGAAIASGDWIDAIGAVAAVAGMLDGKMAVDAFDEAHLRALALHYYLLAADPTPQCDHDFLTRLLSLLLTLAGVAPAPRLDAAPGPSFVVPAVRRLPDGSWLVNGLLPLLAVATAQRLEPAEFFPCTRCGELARLRDRRPTPGKPWFGDHDECRAAARTESLRKANARRSARGKDRS